MTSTVADRGEPRPLDERVERSAAPAHVAVAIDRIAELHPEVRSRLEADDALAHRVVAVTAASRALTRLLESDPAALEVLADVDERHDPAMTSTEDLVAWKRRELLRVAARDLTGVDRLEQTGALLAHLARDVLEGACIIVGAPGLSVIGMGKLGGNELNYASDVDVVFVGEGEPTELDRYARDVMEVARHCFRVDANLRPEGRNGQLVRSIDSYEAYWDRWAEAWEFQALLKARPVAGEAALGARFLDTAQRWLWSRPFQADDIRAVRHLKERSEAEIARKGLADRDVKRGRGGIRDIEFAVQLLQLVHGQLDASLRGPTTLLALAELALAGYVEAEDAEQLASAYRFLRDVEHRLQLVDEQQVHAVPQSIDARDQLARVLGFRDSPRATAVEALEAELRQQQLAVRLIHERVYFRPLLEAFAGSPGALTPEAAVTRLAAFGFTDAKRTQAAVKELTRGLNRSSRLMQQLLPLMLDWLSQAPDPDLGLLMLRNVLTGSHRIPQLVEAFRESPEVARRLCLIFGTSRLVGDLLVRNPDVVVRLGDDERLRTKSRDDLVHSARSAVAWRTETDERQLGLRRWKDRHLIGIAGRDLLGAADTADVGRDLTALAEASLEAALESLEPRLPFAVLALGRFGGGELSYASDLDVVFVYDGGTPSDFEEADRIGRHVLRFLNGATPAGRIYEIDAGLRPEGKQGPMARSVEGFVGYFERWAQVWERQAWIRARPVAGDHALADTLLEQLEPAVWSDGLTADEAREIRRMKARVETERIPVGEDPQYHLKLGRGSLSDIEWAVQLLQLQHGVHAPGTMAALDQLEHHAMIESDDAAVLRETHRFLEHTRNRLFLVRSGPGDSLPTQPEEMTWLARSLGTDKAELRDTYKRLTRRTRRVFERLFYGRG